MKFNNILFKLTVLGLIAGGVSCISSLNKATFASDVQQSTSSGTLGIEQMTNIAADYFYDKKFDNCISTLKDILNTVKDLKKAGKLSNDDLSKLDIFLSLLKNEELTNEMKKYILDIENFIKEISLPKEENNSLNNSNLKNSTNIANIQNNNENSEVLNNSNNVNDKQTNGDIYENGDVSEYDGVLNWIDNNNNNNNNKDNDLENRSVISSNTSVRADSIIDQEQGYASRQNDMRRNEMQMVIDNLRPNNNSSGVVHNEKLSSVYIYPGENNSNAVSQKKNGEVRKFKGDRIGLDADARTISGITNINEKTMIGGNDANLPDRFQEQYDGCASEEEYKAKYEERYTKSEDDFYAFNGCVDFVKFNTWLNKSGDRECADSIKEFYDQAINRIRTYLKKYATEHQKEETKKALGKKLVEDLLNSPDPVTDTSSTYTRPIRTNYSYAPSLSTNYKSSSSSYSNSKPTFDSSHFDDINFDISGKTSNLSNNNFNSDTNYNDMSYLYEFIPKESNLYSKNNNCFNSPYYYNMPSYYNFDVLSNSNINIYNNGNYNNSGYNNQQTEQISNTDDRATKYCKTLGLEVNKDNLLDINNTLSLYSSKGETIENDVNKIKDILSDVETSNIADLKEENPDRYEKAKEYCKSLDLEENNKNIADIYNSISYYEDEKEEKVPDVEKNSGEVYTQDLFDFEDIRYWVEKYMFSWCTEIFAKIDSLLKDKKREVPKRYYRQIKGYLKKLTKFVDNNQGSLNLAQFLHMFSYWVGKIASSSNKLAQKLEKKHENYKEVIDLLQKFYNIFNTVEGSVFFRFVEDVTKEFKEDRFFDSANMFGEVEYEVVSSFKDSVELTLD